MMRFLPYCVLDVLVAEVSLERPGIDAPVRQLVSAGVPQHMGMDGEAEAGRDAEPRDHLAKARRRELTPSAQPSAPGHRAKNRPDRLMSGTGQRRYD